MANGKMGGATTTVVSAATSQQGFVFAKKGLILSFCATLVVGHGGRMVVSADTNGRTTMLDNLRFGTTVTISGSTTADWLFLGWNEDRSAAWLARPQEPGSEKRGPNLLSVSKERISGYLNPTGGPFARYFAERNEATPQKGPCPEICICGRCEHDGICDDCKAQERESWKFLTALIGTVNGPQQRHRFVVGPVFGICGYCGFSLELHP